MRRPSGGSALASRSMCASPTEGLLSTCAREDLTLITGVLLTVWAALIASPDGTRHLVASIRERIAGGVGWILRRRTPPEVHHLSVTDSAVGFDSLDVSVVVRTDDLSQRVDALEQWRGVAEPELAALRRDLDSERRERVAGDEAVGAHAAGQIAGLEQRLAAREQDGYRIEARVIPVALVGFLLSTLPGWLASWPLPLWVIGVALAVAAAVWAGAGPTAETFRRPFPPRG